jgi:PEGA domain-containing protein
MRNASLAAVAAAGIVALSSPAHASEVGVVVTGESWMQPQLANQIESWLGQHGHTLVRSPLPPDAINTLNDCFVMSDQACARSVIEKSASAASVLYARIDSHSNGSAAPDLTLTAYWFNKGHDATTDRKTCQRCTDQTLRSTADEILKKLIGGADLGHVILKSQPPGARISIDGNPPIGITPLDWDLPPGPHTIAMDKPGRKPSSRIVVVGSNRSDLVVLTLPSEGEDDRSDQPSRMLPLGLMIGGGAVAAVGVGLIAFSPGPDPAKRYYYRTWPAGIAVAAIGAAAAGAGAWLWFHSPETTSAPVAAVTRVAAYVGWLGRF